MRYCPNDACPYVKEYGKRSTYQDHVEACLDCGAKLLSGEAPPPPVEEEPPAEPPVELVVVGVFETLEQAQWARVALDSAGVPCFLARSSSSPDEIALQVPGAYEREARDLLEFSAAEGEGMEEPPPEAFGEDEVEDAALSRCPQCGAAEFEIKKDRWAAVFVGIMGVGAPKTGERRERRCRSCGAVSTSGVEE